MRLTAQQAEAAQERVAIPDTPQDRCWLLWRIKTAKLEALWKQLAHLYFGPDQEAPRKDKFAEYVLNGTASIKPPYVVFQAGPRSGAEFWDGCHRFAAYRDSGVESILVGVEWGRALTALRLGVELEPVCERAQQLAAEYAAGLQRKKEKDQ